jgi:hypothetical protein
MGATVFYFSFLLFFIPILGVVEKSLVEFKEEKNI